YDPSLPLVLATDASKIGLGAILSHKLSNGQERPIAYMSRTLSHTEQRYPQIDKEALAIIWAVQKFFYYLYARHFTLFVDNKPLTQILHPEKSLPILCISRMANYADYLSHFNYTVIFKPSKLNTILNDLHTAHVGIVKIKGIARSFVYWPGIDADIERVAKSCAECAKHAHAPPKSRNHHWEYPKGPWERVHIDYAGPVAGVMLLIITDAYSKWLEVKVTNSTTTAATIAILDELFSTYGVPVTIVSDNGRQFVSAEFETFLQVSGVKYHKLTAPYHPSTNGQAERYVQTIKNALNTMSTTQGTIQQNINRFLQQYRKAPHATTGQPPAKLFLGRNIRTRLDLVRPDSMYTKMKEKQLQLDPSSRSFKPGQTIYFLSGNPRMDKWIPGIIVTRLGDLHYEIEYASKRFKRHVDQIRAFISKESECSTDRNLTQTEETQPSVPRRVHFYGDKPQVIPNEAVGSTTPNPQSKMVKLPSTPAHSTIRSQESSPELFFTPPVIPRRSTRSRHPPNRYVPS
ncbi:Uncharacterized protein K02A2.6, partial [Cyphomyrmex costatus]